LLIRQILAVSLVVSQAWHSACQSDIGTLLVTGILLTPQSDVDSLLAHRSKSDTPFYYNIVSFLAARQPFCSSTLLSLQLAALCLLYSHILTIGSLTSQSLALCCLAVISDELLVSPLSYCHHSLK
jgi:hypothetical protein